MHFSQVICRSSIYQYTEKTHQDFSTNRQGVIYFTHINQFTHQFGTLGLNLPLIPGKKMEH